MFEPDYPIETERMLLRPYVGSDLEHLLDLFGREEVAHYLSFGPLDRQGARETLGRYSQLHTLDGDGSALILAAVARNDPAGPPAAQFMLQLLSEKDRQGELGWVVHPDHQGRGLATEGAARLLRLGFEEVGLHRIIAQADLRNDASVRVMERLGMRREAHFRESELLRGDWVDNGVYAILEREWRAATSRT
jgi:RimJ/RimL family protein N-acetyltransferase